MLERTITKIGKKGVIVVPIKLRAHLKLKEGDIVVLEAEDDKLILKRFAPKYVNMGGKISEIIKEIKREELKLEK